MCLFPKTPGDLQCIYFLVLPPGALIANLMKLPMMTATERHSKFIADLEPDRARLCETQMVGIGWLPSADHAWL